MSYSLFEFCHSLLVALCAFVSCKVAAGRSQTACTFNHSILVRTSFCFVVLVVLFHTINDFGFMAIIVLLPGCRRHLPAQCGTEFFDVLAFGCVEFSFVFCLHFPLALLSTRENKSDFDISARFGFVLAGCDRKNEKPEKPKRRKADKPKKTSRKADKPTSRQAAKPQKQSRKVEKSKSQSIINHHIHSFLHSSFIADRIFTTSPIAHRASRIAHHRATP